MDYKYIEQLLNKYWKGETSLEEEQILHSFFQQDDIPQHLAVYKPIFMSFEAGRQTRLGEDFDRKILARIGKGKAVKAVRNTWGVRIQPLLKAAAVIALAVMISRAIQMPFGDDSLPVTSGSRAVQGSQEKEVAATVIPPAEMEKTDIGFDSDTMEHVTDTVFEKEIAITRQ